MTKPKLAIDNDDVLIDFNEGVRVFHNEKYGTDYLAEDMKEFELDKMWKVSFEECMRRVMEFYLSPHFHQMEPIKGAFDALTKLKEKYELYVLTARPEEIISETKLAIDKHYPDLFKDVHFAPFFGAGKKKTKVEVCKELGIKLIIDDGLHNLELCAKEGINCYLFNTPWNEQHNKDELAKRGIVKVNNWSEVVTHLL